MQIGELFKQHRNKPHAVTGNCSAVDVCIIAFISYTLYYLKTPSVCFVQMDDKIFDVLAVAVRTRYAGPTAFNTESLMLNVIMLQVWSYATEFRRSFISFHSHYPRLLLAFAPDKNVGLLNCSRNPFHHIFSVICCCGIVSPSRNEMT